MKTFRADGQPSRDDECDHGFRRFEKCAHCLDAENERLREALEELLPHALFLLTQMEDGLSKDPKLLRDRIQKARAALGEKE